MVGSNDPEEGTATQLSPELWIGFGTTDILVPVFEWFGLEETLVDPRTGSRKPWR
jgi:hypothetical protein